MANTVASQVLFDGTRKHIEQYTIIGDGSGDLSAALMNAVSGNMGTTTKLIHIQAELSGFSAQLLWDASTPVLMMQLPADANIDQDYYAFGGLVNNAGTGKTGDIKITTNGLSANMSGTITFTCLKI
jgi:hypothetical protein